MPDLALFSLKKHIFEKQMYIQPLNTGRESPDFLSELGIFCWLQESQDFALSDHFRKILSA